MTASGVSFRRSVSPRWPCCPPGLLPDGCLRLLVRGGFFSPSLDGGLPLLLLSSPRRRSNSAMRVSCANSSAMSASFDSWFNAARSTESLESARRSHVNPNRVRQRRHAAPVATSPPRLLVRDKPGRRPGQLPFLLTSLPQLLATSRQVRASHEIASLRSQ